MQNRRFLSCLAAMTAALVAADQLQAQRIIIEPPRRPIPVPPRRCPMPVPPRRPIVPPQPRPPVLRDQNLVAKRHAVEVAITDGVAVTNVDQLFFNPHQRTVEGTYIFPLEDDVALGRFSMYVNGEEIEGKLLDVEEARRVYESIVSRMRDPALLEYIGTRMFRARIFPINAKSEVRIKLSYTQMLGTEDGLVRYRYPLDTEKHSAAPIENASVLVNIQSKTPVKSVFSPSHTVAVSRESDHRASASWEAKDVIPNQDFELYYTLSDREFGMTVLTFRESGEDGFFLVRIAPPARTDRDDVLPKDIALVIDTSGSMAGEKIEQARKALAFCLSNLNEEDRFNVIAFSHEPVRFRDSLVAATPDNVANGRSFVDDLKATGGTNINDALLAALGAAPSADADRPYLIVFLTDGLPTIGTTDTKEILKNVSDRNEGRTRLFVFGVGHDVNTHLLDLLAGQNRGTREYVEPGEDLELTLSSFYKKVSDPVLADLALSFGDLKVYDTFPPKPGDLFSGSELVVTGRYNGAGAQPVELTGVRRGTKERFVYETTFPSESGTHEFLPRLWATRKIGYLMDQIRLHGESKELKDEVVRLATAYGIVTPYTAYLVTEPGSVAWRSDARHNLLARTMRQLPPPAQPRRAVAASPGGGVVGMDAVRASTEAKSLQVAEFAAEAAGVAGTTSAGESQPVIRRVGTRTFYLVDGQWTDAAYDGEAQTTKVEAFSDAYFTLLREHPELARCFALGERVLVAVSGAVYETVPPKE